eukprot:TRINITY_DN8943_c0_g1_i1.p1 TRINITY_DN8943_c0_g1~~TRINITY_DN8943_c0_g1_i1.p1  ORF type:complete len:250 (+),score=47.43 TRINITY_DN8943_c0_g1_i1:66-815(+)
MCIRDRRRVHGQKMTILLLIFMECDPQVVERIENDNFEDNHHEWQFYVDLFEQSPIRMIKDEENLKRVENWLYSLNKSQSYSAELLLSDRPYHWRVAQMPAKYNDFLNEYGIKRCLLCNNTRGVGNMSLCLICGDILCSITCEQDSGNELGNLNQHALEKHCGSSVFIFIQNSAIILVDVPRNIRDGFLYLNVLGQEPNPEKRKNLSSYNLDEQKLIHLCSIIQRNSIQQVVTQEMIKKDKMIFERGSL